MEGYLQIQTNSADPWWNSYFVLKNHQLEVYNEKNQKIVQAFILKNVQVIDLGNSLKITTINQEFLLKAETDEERLSWHNELLKVRQEQELQGGLDQEQESVIIMQSEEQENGFEIDDIIKNSQLDSEKNESNIEQSLQLESTQDKSKIISDLLQSEEQKEEILVETVNFPMASDRELSLAFLEEKFPVKYRLLTKNPAFQNYDFNLPSVRKQLPHFINPKEKHGIWSIIKDAIGKDLSKFAVPVYFNEPISMLQKLGESFEYTELLDQANEYEDSCLRLAYAIAFAMTPCSLLVGRAKKPFNPLLAETFELLDEQKGYRFLAEQVSHHPPITAGYCKSQNFEVQTDVNVKISFSGTSIESKEQSTSAIFLKKHGDNIRYNKPQFIVKNLIFGQMCLDCKGSIKIRNFSTKDYGVLEFNPKGWSSSKYPYKVLGQIQNDKNEVKYKLEGKYNEYLKAIKCDTIEEIILWSKKPQIPNPAEQYNFTEFTLQSNYLSPELLLRVAPTDCRLRPDQRAWEYGLKDLASSEKLRLEIKQRERRKLYENNSQSHTPRWFTEKIDELTKEKRYFYHGGYWEARAKAQFNDLLDIY